jgi:hypothetical protein
MRCHPPTTRDLVSLSLLVLVMPAALLGIAGPAAAGVIHVPAQYVNIHDAVQACGAGDTVMVAAGTYHDCTHETEGPGSVPACVIMKSGVTLRGAGQTATIIDAQASEGNDGRGIFVENVTDCRIENLQVTGAYAEVYGAGILVRQVGSTVAITDVMITGNDDGGIICIDHAHPVMTRVTFRDNVAKQGGGLAIEEYSNPQVIDCVVEQNQAPVAAGVVVRIECAPIFSGCAIQNNVVPTNGEGGGMTVLNSTVTMDDCVIAGNATQGNGGGISLNASSGSLTGCEIRDNTTSGGYSLGGGLYMTATDVALTDCLLTGNTTTGYYGQGGGVYCAFNPGPTFENCTFAENGCGAGGMGGGLVADWYVTPVLNSCIIAFSTAGAGMSCTNDALPSSSCCDIFGNAGGDLFCGKQLGGNFSANPLFCDLPTALWDLGENSPCAAGNHPYGQCGGLIGARPVGCGFIGVPDGPPLSVAVVTNTPNPFNPRTRIFFVLPEDGSASLRIHDLRGRTLRTWDFSGLSAGSHEVIWDGRDADGRSAASGVYICELSCQGRLATRRMALLR